MRVFIADALPRVRYALRVLLQQLPSVEVVGEEGNAARLLAHVASTAPDIVLLDWRLAGPDPQELLRRMRQLKREMRVVALSERPEERTAALSSGADGFASKCDAAAGLLAAIASCTSIGGTD